MLILGIETSGTRGEIAVCRDADCLAEAALENAPRRHAQTLVSQLNTTLKRLGLRVADLDGIAVSMGPGSFTGLRVGVVCAKTLAYVTGCRLAAVDTLQAIAANTPPDVATVHVLSDAQRGDLFVGTYNRIADGEWIREGEISIVKAEPWFQARHPDDTLCGPALAVYGSIAPTTCRVLPEAAWSPRARIVASIGRRQIERGDLADCATLEPFYLRRSSAEEKRDPSPTR